MKIKNAEENNFLNNQMGIKAGEIGQITEIKEKNLQNTEAKIFLVNRFPFLARLTLTIFFNILVLFALLSYFSKKENYLLRVFNALAILVLAILPWIPQII